MRAPILAGELELTEPIAALRPAPRADGADYTGALLLVRMQHIPVGYVALEPGAFGADALARTVWAKLGPVINDRRSRAGLPRLDGLPVEGVRATAALADEPGELPPMTVVVCTRNRPDSVLVTLRRIAALRYPAFEVVVVDNAPSSDATKEAVARNLGDDLRFRYVREPRPGLSRARNRGLAEATADIVAFTDDDVLVDPWWLTGIARGLRAATGVACVTGLIATAELENAAQLYFHLREEWGASCERRVFDLTENRDDSPLYPYSAGVFGAGANFAVSRTVMTEIGGFNEALGAGTPSGGGEDLNMFMRIVLAGHRLVYEPSAVVSHVHRADVADLSRQMRAYGSGCTAALTAIMLSDPRARRELPPKAVAGVARMLRLSGRVRGNQSLPAGLIEREIGGFLIGPWLYFQGRRDLRQAAAISGRPPASRGPSPRGAPAS
jgi:GT2 family glycosyltransferase